MTDDSFVTLPSGDKMPKLGLGTWAQTNMVNTDQHDAQSLANAVRTAVEHGYRHIDTAWAYFNEKEIGVILKDLFDRKVVERKDLFITTKLFSFFHSPEKAEKSVRDQLKDLQLDYIDMFLIHGPIEVQQDPARPKTLMPIKADGTVDMGHTPHIDTWRALEACVEKGLIRNIGVSNFNSKQIQRLCDQGKIKPANLQVECHPYFPQEELRQFCAKRGIAFTAYSPIGSPGIAALNPNHPKLMQDPVVVEMAKKYKKTPAQLLIRYQYDRGNVVIPKSTNPDRIKANFDIFDFKLTSDDIAKLTGLKQGRMLGSGYAWAEAHEEFPWKEPF